MYREKLSETEMFGKLYVTAMPEAASGYCTPFKAAEPWWQKIDIKQPILVSRMQVSYRGKKAAVQPRRVANR